MDSQYLKMLTATAQGDRQAFASLYNATAARLFAVSLQLLKRRDLAEEVVQEAYVRIWHNAADYQAEKGTVMTWMISITRYRALDMLRSARVRREQDDEGHEPLDTHSPEMDLDQERDRVRLDNCMDHLEDDQRHAIQLAYFRGLTHNEVCTRLNSPLGSVKSWIRRGLQRLKRCLEP